MKRNRRGDFSLNGWPYSAARRRGKGEGKASKSIRVERIDLEYSRASDERGGSGVYIKLCKGAARGTEGQVI